MTDIVLVHSSDLHVDNDPTQGPYGEDGTTGLRVVLEAGKAHNADFVLLVGDVFDNNRQPAHILDRSTELLASAGRPVLILPGNHDPVTPDSVYLRGEMAKLPNVHIIGVTHEQVVHFPDPVRAARHPRGVWVDDDGHPSSRQCSVPESRSKGAEHRHELLDFADQRDVLTAAGIGLLGRGVAPRQRIAQGEAMRGGVVREVGEKRAGIGRKMRALLGRAGDRGGPTDQNFASSEATRRCP